MRTEALARAHLTARNFGFAESTAKSAVEKQPNQVPPLAALVEILHAVGKDEEAHEGLQQARAAGAVRRPGPAGLPAARADRRSAGRPTRPGRRPAAETSVAPTTRRSNRIDLTTLGPLAWSPSPAEPFAASRHRRQATGRSPTTQGKNVVVLFFLGGKCAHCMQQLELFGKEFEALKELNTDVVAISTDDLEATEALKENADRIKFPMPMLADPELELFKRYQAFDDFESQPLHGTFLIDAQGNVRFQRISAEPFLDVDFIKAEAARVNRMLQDRNGH